MDLIFLQENHNLVLKRKTIDWLWVYWTITSLQPIISSFFTIEFIGVTLVSKIYRFQWYNFIIPPLYTVLCVHHPKFLSITIHSPFILLYLPPSPFLSIITILFVSVRFFVCFLLLLFNPFTFFTTLHSLPLWQLSVYFYFVCLFCSLDSTCKWNHMVFVFLWLAYFT